MRIAAILLSALLVGAIADDRSIVLSVASKQDLAPLSERVVLVITLRNRSDRPLYVHRNVDAMLDFAVRDAAGRLVRGFMHPPGMPLIATDSREMLRIGALGAYRCFIEVPLADLGIERAGVFALEGFWSGTSTKAPESGSKYQNHFEHAETTYLTITGEKTPAGAGSQPTPQTPEGDLPMCRATKVEPRPAR